jgi:hypothetical protein
MTIQKRIDKSRNERDEHMIDQLRIGKTLQQRIGRSIQLRIDKAIVLWGKHCVVIVGKNVGITISFWGYSKSVYIMFVGAL